MALFLALASPELQIDGLTIVFGNHHDLSILSRNACMILQMAGRLDIPVYLGAETPLVRDFGGFSGVIVHGEDGVGNLTNLPIQNVDLSPIQKISAAEFIVTHCRANPGEITLITLGPLTNIALAIKLEKNLGKLLKSVVSMAGGICLRPELQHIGQNRIGNKTPVAEANVQNDPESARIVFNSNLPLVIFTINLTHSILMKEDFLKAVKSLGSIGKFIHDSNVHYSKFYASVNEEVPIHDSTPVMWVIAPHLFSNEITLYCDVETQGNLTCGMLVPDWRHQLKKDDNVRVFFGVDHESFLKEYLKRIATLQLKE